LGKKRIDNLLVDRGLVESRSKAQAMIMAGDVTVDGNIIRKAGTLVSQDAEILMAEPPPFVSRGGLKLEAALRAFEVVVAGKVEDESPENLTTLNIFFKLF